MLMDHLELATKRFEAMCAFYDQALSVLNIRRVTDGSPAGYGVGDELPFWIRRADIETANAHFAFVCASRSVVEAAYETAAAAGGVDLRKPRVHEHIDPNYYAGYARDPDGHLVEFVTRTPEGAV